MAPSVTVAEVLEALRNARHPDGDGFTSRELMRAMGCGIDKARRILRDLMEAGRLECVGRRRYTRVDGSPGQLPVYRML